jgi:hypothetical protein
MRRTFIRWVLLPFAAILAFVLVGVCAERVAIALEVWTYPVIGFCAAFAVVATVYFVAPGQKLLAAFISYAIGGVLAYEALKDCYDPRTYEPTLMPLWVTLAGGAIALAAVAVHSFGKGWLPSNTSLERTRER